MWWGDCDALLIYERLAHVVSGIGRQNSLKTNENQRKQLYFQEHINKRCPKDAPKPPPHWGLGCGCERRWNGLNQPDSALNRPDSAL
jgi:hypothetical protein